MGTGKRSFFRGSIMECLGGPASDATDAPSTCCSLSVLLPNPALELLCRDAETTCHPGDIVTGTLEILSGRSLVLDKISVVLEGGHDRKQTSPIRWLNLPIGVVRTWMTELTHAERVSAVQHKVCIPRPSRRKLVPYSDRTQFLKQVQPLSCSNSQSIQILAAETYVVPFSFLIPEHYPSTDGLHEQLLRLPPSLDGGEVAMGLSGRDCMQPLIEYTIRCAATFHAPGQRKNMDVYSSCKLKLIPFTEVGPPIEQTDFPGEFKTRCTAVVKKHPLASSFGEVSISMREPEPLRMLSNGIAQCSKGWIKFTFRPSRISDSQPCPKRWTCKFVSQIHIKTFYSSEPISEMASNDLLERDSHIRLRSTHICLGSRMVDLTLRELEEVTPGDRPGRYGTRAYSATLLLPIGNLNNLLPTFCSPLAARRYSLQVRLSIKGFCHHQLLLEAPLQVHYCSPIHCITHGKRQDSENPCGSTTAPRVSPTLGLNGQQIEVSAATSDLPPTI